MIHEIRFTSEAREHLSALRARERKMVLAGIERALSYEPIRETRNVKMLRPNPLSRYELRVGSFRVFFDVLETAREVLILAVGKKEGIFIAGKETRL